MTNVGLIGYGVMGAEIARALFEGKAGDARLVALYGREPSKASQLASLAPYPVACHDHFDDFLATNGMHLVVECASPAAVRAFGRRVLEADLDLLVASSGALCDKELFQSLTDLTVKTNLRLMVPSGALGGIDAIRAVRCLLEEVRLTTTKNPRSLSGAPGFKEWEGTITEPKVVFEGNALEAIERFPANINVGVTLSIAGLGPKATKITIVADPKVVKNVHEIYAHGAFGVMHFRIENEPHVRNPRTSYLAILSVVETLRSACTAGPRIGT